MAAFWSYRDGHGPFLRHVNHEQLGTEAKNESKKITSNHLTTSSLDSWYKAGGIHTFMFPCTIILPCHLNAAVKIKAFKTSFWRSIFCWTIGSWQDWKLVCALQIHVMCIQGILHALVERNCHCCLHITPNWSAPLSFGLWTSTGNFIPHNSFSLENFLYSGHYLYTLETAVNGNPSRPQLSEQLRPAHLDS